jgi:CheY-like chemotaxis protein
VPQAPLSPARTVHQLRPFTPSTYNSGYSPPVSRHPLQQAGEEPPRGRILVVEDQPATALEIQRLLLNLGYRVVGPAGSRDEAQRLIERIPIGWPLRCALIDIRCPDIGRISAQLSARGAPIVWMIPRDTSASAPTVPFAAPVLHLPTDRSGLQSAIGMAGRQVAPPDFYVTAPPQQAWPREFPQL